MPILSLRSEAHPVSRPGRPSTTFQINPELRGGRALGDPCFVGKLRLPGHPGTVRLYPLFSVGYSTSSPH